MHLTSNGCVAIRFKMLTYYVYAPLLNRIDALPLNVIYNFKIASNVVILESRAGLCAGQIVVGVVVLPTSTRLDRICYLLTASGVADDCTFFISAMRTKN